MLHQFKQTNDLVHQRLLELEEKVRQLNRSQGKDKESAAALKKIMKELEDLDEIVYKDIKKTKISEPVQTISPTKELSAQMQTTKVR